MSVRSNISCIWPWFITYLLLIKVLESERGWISPNKSVKYKKINYFGITVYENTLNAREMHEVRPDCKKMGVWFWLIAAAVFVSYQIKDNDGFLLVDGSGMGRDRWSLCFECKNFSQFLESSYVCNGFGALISKNEANHCLNTGTLNLKWSFKTLLCLLCI